MTRSAAVLLASVSVLLIAVAAVFVATGEEGQTS